MNSLEKITFYEWRVKKGHNQDYFNERSEQYLEDENKSNFLVVSSIAYNAGINEGKRIAIAKIAAKLNDLI